jgi:hypothetical protein
LFFENSLKADYVSDDANTYTASGNVGSIFEGISLSFDDSTLLYDVDFPDVISPRPGAIAAMNYSGGLGGNAALQVAGTGGRGNIVMFGFPFETIATAANRAAVIDRVFDFFGLATLPPPNADFNRDGTVDTVDYVIWRKTSGKTVPPGTAGDADGNGKVNQDDHQFWRAQFGTSPGATKGAALRPNRPASAQFSRTCARAPRSTYHLSKNADKCLTDRIIGRHDAIWLNGLTTGDIQAGQAFSLTLTSRTSGATA